MQGESKYLHPRDSDFLGNVLIPSMRNYVLANIFHRSVDKDDATKKTTRKNQKNSRKHETLSALRTKALWRVFCSIRLRGKVAFCYKKQDGKRNEKKEMKKGQ